MRSTPPFFRDLRYEKSMEEEFEDTIVAIRIHISPKHTYKTNDRVTRTPVDTRG